MNKHKNSRNLLEAYVYLFSVTFEYIKNSIQLSLLKRKLRRLKKNKMQTQIDSILKDLSKFLFERRFQFQGVYRMSHSKPYNLIIESWSKTIDFDEFVFRDENAQLLNALDDLDDLIECRLYGFILNSLHGEEKDYFEKQIKKVRLLFKVQQSYL